jgi:hypothetical protein
MGFFSNLFSGGLYSISDKDIKAMTAKEGYVRFAFRYVGGNLNYPSKIESVLELSLLNNPACVINVYANQSSAGIEVQPGQFLFSIPMKKIIKVENNNQREFSGAFLIGGLGAILQETRYFVVIHYYDDNNVRHQAAFGTTPAIKSEAYFDAFYKAFIGTLTEINPQALSGEIKELEQKEDVTSQLEKLAALKEKGMLTAEEFIAAKAKLLNGRSEEAKLVSHPEAAIANAATPAAPPPPQKFKVKIKGPDYSKKMYIATKAFCDDTGVAFDKAKAHLTKGVVMNFEDKNSALQFVEKYSHMDCKAALQENTQ